MKVYGLPSGQELYQWNDMAWAAAGSGHIIMLVQALALGQSINLRSAVTFLNSINLSVNVDGKYKKKQDA